ncbi:MAG: rod-binding protein [Armatimonadota bacterium]
MVAAVRPVTAVKSDEAEALRLRRACQDFEAIFLACLLRNARRAAGAEGPDGVAKLYRDMADTALADAVARSGGIGIARMLEAQLRAGVGRAQEANNDAVGRRPAEER